MNPLFRKIQLPKIIDQRGALSFLESNNHIPFDIISTSIITELNNFKKSNELKKNNDKFLLALSGSLTIRVFNQNSDEIISLNNSNIGIYISRKLKTNLINFSSNAILLIIEPDSNEK